MGYLKQNEGEKEVGGKFVAIVSTQSFCLLKLGDFLTAKKFADQELRRTASVEAQYVRSEIFLRQEIVVLYLPRK